MDAQNAVEPASTKPAASPKRPGSDSDQSRLPITAKSIIGSKPDLSHRDARPGAPTSNATDGDGGADGNSDAETIVLPGKDGHSPSKVRKIIKREDKSDTEDVSSLSRGGKNESNGKQGRDVDKGDRAEKNKSVSVVENGSSDRPPSMGPKRKKLADKSKAKDGSSGLSSAPASPPQQRRRRSSNAHSKSDSETAQVESSPKVSNKEKPKPVDKLVSHKRKAPRPDSDDEAESRKVRRQRTSGSGLDASRKSHPPAKPHHDAHPSTRTRSISPQPRAHRRSVSTQLPGHSANGLSHKKKRVPAPLQSTDYHSDESSASGSPHPRSSKLRSLATPATTESTVSPAKMAPHKKHLDAHGQTFLARACAKGEYETAKHRLQERPEDINVADYAGNTPLQIAALNGFDDIVKLLVDAGCNLDCVNNDKDTPLLDAVENGHLEVVKILLAAGVNPRKANAYGNEPVDRIDEESEHADEIRRALEEAKQRMGDRRRTSTEDHHLEHNDARSSHGPDSPRRSPGATGSIHAASGRRAGTVRSTKTSNHLLYMPMDDKTLRAAAARGDEETVIRILQVRETFDDPESMVAAARGGHDIVMQLLLALGKANPDPAPIANNDHSTPMLAAIGQENIKVIKLLLDQNDFDPTRKYKGETYYEIARRRRGPNWAEEEHMLKLAYDEFKKSHRGDAKTKSPNRREQDRDSRRARAEPKDKDEPGRAHKRKASSPTREPKKAGPPKVSTSPKEKKRSDSFNAQQDDQTSPKRGPGRPKKEDRIPTIAISDREASPAGKQPTTKAKRAEPDLAAASSEGETVKPRRKLISRGELKGERAQHRRTSITSNASSLKEPSSPREEPDKTQRTEKYHDRTKALKRDESRDRLPVSGESSGKRHRSSATPPHSGSAEKDTTDGPVKRRRLDADGKERRLKPSSTDDKHLKAPSAREPGWTASPRVRSKSRDVDDRRPTKSKKPDVAAEQGRRESGKSHSSENSIHVKSEDPDVDMPDVDQAMNEASKSRAALQKEKEAEEKRAEEKRRIAEAEAQVREAKRKEEEKRRAEEEEKEKERIRLEEEVKRRAEAEARREEEERKRKEEEQRKLKEEEERKQREIEERRRREEEERKRKEEEERKRKEEEERQRKEEERKRREEEERKKREEEQRRRKEDEERRRREEEERLRKEQLEREAAEELRRKREEEERKERERKHQEMERRRLAREAEQRRLRQEQERARLAKLPPLLRWLDTSVNPKIPEVAERFRVVQGVRYDCICPEATGTSEGREQWLLNTQVALLLGEKDLKLSRYTAWIRKPASFIAKRAIWRVESDRYALTAPALYELGKQLPEYYGAEGPESMPFDQTARLRREAWEKFAAMELFFVKASDFMYIVPTVHHLRNIKLIMEYREIPEDEAASSMWVAGQKWKADPDWNRNCGFAPPKKHYVNGELISEEKAGQSAVSHTPFPEKRVPRRGLVAVSPDDPAYLVLCKAQGLNGSAADGDSPLLPNGLHGSPAAPVINGVSSPSASANYATNHPISPSSESGPAQARPLVNGVNGINGGSTPSN